MKKTFYIFLILLFALSAWAETLYVRPLSGEYGAEDGSSYAAAFDGFADISWGAGAGQLGAGDTLCLAGTHGEQFVINGSGTSGSRINIVSHTVANGCGSADAGSISGVNTGSYGGAINLNNDDWITFDGITVTGTTGSSNENNFGVNSNSSEYITFKNCTITDNRHSGWYIYNASSNWIIESCTVTGNGGNGVIIEGGDITIRYNTFDNNGTGVFPDIIQNRCAADNTGGSFYHNIYLGIDSSGPHYVYENVITDTQCGQGIKAKATAYIYLNYIRQPSPGDYGIMLIANVGKAGETTSYYVYHNIIEGVRLGAIDFYTESASSQVVNLYIYNNTIYDSLRGFDCYDNAGPESIDVRNNIFDMNGNRECFHYTSSCLGGSFTVDYNLCDSSDGTPYFWGNADNLTEWRARGFDANGDDVADVKLNNPAADEFWLQSSSPAVNVGENLGASYNDALGQLSSWPDAVVTLDQDAYNSWEIGAYVYSAGASPPVVPDVTGININ